MSYCSNYVEITDLVGKVITEVDGLEEESDVVQLFTECGYVYEFYHEQDCCEYVTLNDFEGNVSGLVKEAYESTNSTDHFGENLDDSFTWTFYNIRTQTDSLWMRWLGESNGYYSESVRIKKYKLGE